MLRQQIVPNIWCNRNAEEAGAFYASVFPGSTYSVEARYPEADLLDFQREFAGAPLTVALEIAAPRRGSGKTRLTLINAGDEFQPNPSVSLLLNFDPKFFGEGTGDEEAARAQMNEVWEQLIDGGSILMPLEAYPFSAHYGWVQDRFGVSWQIMLTDPEGDPRPFVTPSLMFGGAAQNRAAEAIDYYVSVFDDAAAGNQFHYGATTGPANAASLMFGEFRIDDQWIAVMESGVTQDFSFTCGMSLEVQCADQREIDHLWTALSAVPEAEQCGWLTDRFGVSWQIVPANLAALMERPDAYAHMMEMKKLVIDEF